MERNYKIIVVNGGGALVYEEKIKAKNENKAIKEILDKIEIFDGDSIQIEEVGDDE